MVAISGSNDLIHIAVTAPTAAETAELYERKRRYWTALAQAEPSRAEPSRAQTAKDTISCTGLTWELYCLVY